MDPHQTLEEDLFYKLLYAPANQDNITRLHNLLLNINNANLQCRTASALYQKATSINEDRVALETFERIILLKSSCQQGIWEQAIQEVFLQNAFDQHLSLYEHKTLEFLLKMFNSLDVKRISLLNINYQVSLKGFVFLFVEDGRS